VPAERRAAAARRAEERRLERQVRRQAKEQAARAREQARRLAAAGGARPLRGSAYEGWLDERDVRLPLTRADLRSRSDELAEGAVAAGGGIEAVIEATGLRSRENVLRGIEPAVLVRAFANDDAAAAAAQPERSRLRRLLPDAELVRRRAAGEPLRRLARDYDVAHTTLARYFARPQVAGQLRALARPLPNLGAGQPGKPLALRTGARQTSASSKTTATTGSTQPAAASSPSSRRCEPSRPKADADRRCR
jgi:hypothetical protein